MSKLNLQNKKSNAGVSMIELIVGIGLISVVLMTITLMTTRSLQLAEAAKNRQKAVIYAQDGIEQIRKQRALLSWQEFSGDVNVFAGSLSDTNPNDDGLKRTVIIELDNSNYSVEVVVKWDDFKGAHDVTQTTVLSNWNN